MSTNDNTYFHINAFEWYVIELIDPLWSLSYYLCLDRLANILLPFMR